MTPARKDLIIFTYSSQRANQSAEQVKHPTLWRLFILVLVSWLSWGSISPALAIPSLFPENHSSVMIITQQKDSKVPQAVVNAVRQDLSRRTNIATDKLKLKSASRQTWPDGCLGLASSDQICTQALIEGWRVVISHKNQTWVYRTDGQGRVIKLEK